MISTKTIRQLLLFIFIVSSVVVAHAQEQPFIAQLKQISKRLKPEEAGIRINNKEATYNDLLAIPDSTLLKIELYEKKDAVKLFGKEDGRNGLLLVTLRKPDNEKHKTPGYLYNDNGDSIHCEKLLPATIGGDTTLKSWTQFLIKNLKADTPVENGCPPGLYHVYFTFVVDTSGNVGDVKVLADPGYSCGAEVKRLMKQSPKWDVGKCEDRLIRFRQQQRVTFMISMR